MVIASGNTLRDGPLALRSRRRRRLAGASPALGKPLGFHAPHPEEAAPRRPSRRIEANDRPFFTSVVVTRPVTTMLCPDLIRASTSYDAQNTLAKSTACDPPKPTRRNYDLGALIEAVFWLPCI